MVLRAALTHSTVYRYDRLVNLGPQVIRLRPAPHCRTPIIGYSLKVRPKEHFINWQQDPFGNFLARVVVPEKTTEFVVEVDLVADVAVVNPFDFFLEPEAAEYPFSYAPDLARDLAPYLETEPAGARLRAWLAEVPRRAERTSDFLVALNRRLQRDIEYIIRLEPGVQAPEETLALAKGSCRDSGWLLVQILRQLGLAARFASGYLIQLTPDVRSLDGPSGPSADFTDLHAWAEVYLPGAGWVGLDPTSGLLTGEGHIPLACTPSPGSAAPITGTLDECEVEFSHHMTVSRVLESPRVTKPYSEAQWADVLALGDRIEAELQAGDVRLTIGGEPTFVSLDYMDGAEWNTEAVGPNKRYLADNLITRLRDRFAPHGLLHHGQGKWYPGESLPRWAFSLYWRGDGSPLWQAGQLIADEATNYRPSAEDAQSLIEGIALRLGVNPNHALPAFEDPLHYLGREQRLPINVTPEDNRLENAEERARMARVFSRGLTRPSGYVLPVQRWNARDGRRWASELWATRSPYLLLMPGDSPVGFRLPLESLFWLPPRSYPYTVPADPFMPTEPLPAPDPERQPFLRGQPVPTFQRQRPQPPATGISVNIRTALCVEPRDGRLCVFMPPTETTEDYLDLIAAIEDTVAEKGMPVHLEGYQPPPDPRLNLIKVTPDPGVIEVNIHPARSWRQAVEITGALYEDARQCRLGTEKFMLDGRHSGTGGGNHIVVGGPQPWDSPFLRRPDLLRSLITYWQNHPSLSYLFSSLFLGPTSQAPRIDEGRADLLYEIEIALAQIPDPGMGWFPAWQLDRTLRNLLIDVTGNTHRTEICIDKLYSPEGTSGRLGLVEFRAFEMPPHPRMSLAQQLLLRALIAWFWRTPYRRPLIRFGTALQDKFMLGHHVWQDFRDVLRELNEAGYALQEAWFAPHFEFRFPLFGWVSLDDVRIELRQALEPWHVMGEQGEQGGTVRYVDSSVERLQLKVNGLTGERHAVCCNGRRTPLQPTGTPGEYVAGVRYRAWWPAACLHPTIGIHTPLVFDLVDTWSGRSLGGCTYHVAHPGGRHYEIFPVNAYEAEGRRLARFQPFGHTPGPMQVRPERGNPDFPMTLDLRRQ
jgi:uncharacterized protein (DUF2126 family)